MAYDLSEFCDAPNQEGARLVADLSHAQKTLYDQQAHGRKLEQKLVALQAIEQRNSMLVAQLADKEQLARSQQEQLVAAVKMEELTALMRKLELVVATARAKLDARQDFVAELLDQLDAPAQQPVQGRAGT